MSDDTYKKFKDDYDLFYSVKDLHLWKDVLYIRQTNKRFMLDIYNKLKDKYDYTEYIYLVRTDRVINKLINNIMNDNPIKAILVFLSYSLTSYLGFIIEETIKDKLLSVNDLNVISNYNLDIYNKCDLMINKFRYQLKSYSFIEASEYIDERMEKYKDKGLEFIFYVYEKDNIYIAMIDNKITIDADIINGFTWTCAKTNITIDDFINRIKEVKV